jgi:glutamate racemase
MLYRPIAVFDSGLGSLSVVRELRKIIPAENILYFADRLNFPYGRKSKDQLKSIIIKSIKFLEKYKPKLIVMASNTPSVQIFEEIKNDFSIDIIPTKPPLNRSVKLSTKNHIAIMASNGILNSKEFNYLINKEVPQDVFITKIDSSDIIDIVEDGSFLLDKIRTFKTIQKIIKSNFNDSIDVVALSSTHLPFIKNYLLELLPSIKFIDSASQVAKDTKNYLQFNNDLTKNGTGKLEILASSNKKDFQSILRYMGTKEIIYDVSLQF